VAGQTGQVGVCLSEDLAGPAMVAVVLQAHVTITSASQYCIHIAHVSTLLQLRRAWQTDRLRICVAVSADLLMIPRAYVSADCGMDVQRTQDEQSESTCAPLLRINTC
jgi:hypothetical protein